MRVAASDQPVRHDTGWPLWRPGCRPYRVLFAVAVKWLAEFSLKPASTVEACLRWCRAVWWCQVREWLVRRAGVRGVSWPRWSQSRSPVALPGPSRGPGGRRPGGGRRWRR
jgi:hypothetical protein